TPAPAQSSEGKSPTANDLALTLALNAADRSCPATLAGIDCMACCAEHHPEAADRVKDVTRECVCSASQPTGCRAQCAGYCAGKPDNRDCYLCAFRQMSPGAVCFRPALEHCTDSSCIDSLACRAVCAETPLPR